MRFKDIWGKIEIPTNQDDFPHQGFSPKCHQGIRRNEHHLRHSPRRV